MSSKNSYRPLLIIFAILGPIILFAFVLINPFELHDHFVEPPLLVKDFALQTTNGSTFHLSDQKGKIVLLFFGYTNCPDFCPTTLTTFKQVYEKLGEDAPRVKFVMISVDPDRDTPEKIAAYVAQFNSDFSGLSGSRKDLEPIWNQFGVLVEKQNSDSVESYLEGHTASVYVIDKQGYFIRDFPYGTSATDLVDNITQLLNQ